MPFRMREFSSPLLSSPPLSSPPLDRARAALQVLSFAELGNGVVGNGRVPPKNVALCGPQLRPPHLALQIFFRRIFVLARPSP